MIVDDRVRSSASTYWRIACDAPRGLLVLLSSRLRLGFEFVARFGVEAGFSLGIGFGL